MVYPGEGKAGLSSLAIHRIYSIINEIDGFSCDLFFSDSKTSYFLDLPLKDFDLIAFSITYEEHLFSAAKLLKEAGIPPLRAEREKGNFPAILGGGIGIYYNPAPFLPLFDFIFLGEGEERLKEILIYLKENDEESLLKSENLMVSKTYSFKYSGEKVLEIEGERKRIHRFKGFPKTPSHSCFLSEETAFKDLFLIELNRGCVEKCRFCVASYMGLPYREKEIEVVEKEIKLAAKYGRRIGLIGAGVTDYSKMEELYKLLKKHNVKASFSSLKASSKSPFVIEIIKESQQKTVTLAPETGRESLRFAINKKVPDERYFEFTKELFSAGAENLKLYFLVGLPTETKEDLEAIVKMVKEFYKTVLPFWKKRGKRGEIHVSVNPVIPKPFTPLQWYGMEKKSLLEKKIRFLQKELRKVPSVRFSFEKLNSAILQGIISRGDTVVGEAAIISAEKGIPFRKTLKELERNFELLYTREREREEIFPWEVVESGIRREYLWREYQMIYKGKQSPSCFPGCKVCGLCE